MRVSEGRRPRRSLSLMIATAALAVVSRAAMADTFGPVRFDSKSDAIVVTMRYEGTNPNHHFSIHWGPCRKLRDQLHGPAPKFIDLGVIDDQGNDAAQRSYTRTLRIPLTGMACRPATVNLWTSYNQHASIHIP